MPAFGGHSPNALNMLPPQHLEQHIRTSVPQATVIQGEISSPMVMRNTAPVAINEAVPLSSNKIEARPTDNKISSTDKVESPSRPKIESPEKHD